LTPALGKKKVRRVPTRWQGEARVASFSPERSRGGGEKKKRKKNMVPFEKEKGGKGKRRCPVPIRSERRGGTK